MNNINALILVLLVGLTTTLGSLIVFIYKKKNNKAIGISLGMSAGVMIYLIVFDMFAEMSEGIVGTMSYIYLTLCIIGGYLFSWVIDKLIPHHHEDEYNEDEEAGHLLHVGIITVMSTMLHNILEGIAIYTTCVLDQKTGMNLAIGTIMHNIPIGFMIATIFYFSHDKKIDALKYTLIVALSTFIGGLIGFGILSNIQDIGGVLPYMIAAIAGTIIYLVVNELIPTTIEYCKVKLSSIVIILSVIVMVVFEKMM